MLRICSKLFSLVIKETYMRWSWTASKTCTLLFFVCFVFLVVPRIILCLLPPYALAFCCRVVQKISPVTTLPDITQEIRWTRKPKSFLLISQDSRHRLWNTNVSLFQIFCSIMPHSFHIYISVILLPIVQLLVDLSVLKHLNILPSFSTVENHLLSFYWLL